MSAPLTPVESQWLSQLAAMRKAIADLKLPKDTGAVLYGEDLDLDEDQLSSMPVSVENIWDIISDDGTISDDDLDDINDVSIPAATAAEHGSSYNFHWLEMKCQAIANENHTLDASELLQRITNALSADGPSEKLQISLTEITG